MGRVKLPSLIAFLVVASWLALTPCAQAGVTSDTPLKDVRKVNTLIGEHLGDDFHIVLIHGIRTADRTTWDGFRALLCQHLAKRCAGEKPEGRITDHLILAAHAPMGNFIGTTIWPTDKEWIGSRPFVDHYLFHLTGGGRLFVDEINWWPLVFAFKCQFIVADDTTLVGPAKDNITNCAANDDTHFPWFSPAVEATLLATRPISGGAPPINASLKTGILDWGISDAVLSLGTLKDLLRETVRCAFADISRFDAINSPGSSASLQPLPSVSFDCGADERSTSDSLSPSNAHFVIISHSLGAFLLMDTFAAAAADANYYQQFGADKCRFATSTSLVDLHTVGQTSEKAKSLSQKNQSLCAILASSNYLYFFANQFPLLELGRAQGLSDFHTEPNHAPAQCIDALSLWAGCGTLPEGQKQIVAFSDPGDILTFKVPKIRGASVINVYTHNAMDWFGLFEWPASAHTKYITSDSVLKVVFGD